MSHWSLEGHVTAATCDAPFASCVLCQKALARAAASALGRATQYFELIAIDHVQPR